MALSMLPQCQVARPQALQVAHEPKVRARLTSRRNEVVEKSIDAPANAFEVGD